MAPKAEIVICMGSSCYARGNKVSLELIKAWLNEKKIEAEISFKGQLCSGLCSKGPILMINNQVYQDVHPANVLGILQAAINEVYAEK